MKHCTLKKKIKTAGHSNIHDTMKRTNSRNIEMSGGSVQVHSKKAKGLLSLKSCGNIDCGDLEELIKKSKDPTDLNLARADDLKKNVDKLKNSYEEFKKNQAEIKRLIKSLNEKNP